MKGKTHLGLCPKSLWDSFSQLSQSPQRASLLFQDWIEKFPHKNCLNPLLISSYGYEEVRLQPVRRPRSCLPTFYLSTHLLLIYLLTYLPAHFPPIYLPAHLPTYFLPTYRLPTSFLPTSYLLTHLPAYLPKANCLKALGLEFICTIRGLNSRSYEQLFHLQVSVEKKKHLACL